MGESSFSSYSFCSSSSSLLFWDRLSRRPCWPQVHYTFRDDLEVLILLPPVPECWDFRPVSPFPAAGDWTPSLGMRDSTKRAASQFWSLLYGREWRHDTLALSTAEKIKSGEEEPRSDQGCAAVVEQVTSRRLWAHRVHLVTHGYNRAWVSWPQLARWWHQEVGLWPRNSEQSQTLWNAQRLLTAALFKESQREACKAPGLDPGAACSQSICLIASSIIFRKFKEKAKQFFNQLLSPKWLCSL